MREYIEAYVEFLKRKGFGPATVYGVEKMLRWFYEYLDKKKVETLRPEVFGDYRNYLLNEHRTYRGEKLKAGTIQSRLYEIRKYFRYLTFQKKYLVSPARHMEVPKIGSRVPRAVPGAEEAARAIDGINTGTPWGLRARAVFEILYSCGLRARELSHLNWYDVDFQAGKVRVRGGKGGKDRVVPAGAKALAVIGEYLEKGRSYYARRKDGNPALFLEQWEKRMTYPSIREVIRRYRGGNQRITAHGLRHACAVGMLRNGADLRYIQEMLGHKFIETTQVYTRLCPVDLKEAQKKYHPRESGRMDCK